MTGEELIGRARERWEEIDNEGLDWRSFFNGWCEGRADLMSSKLTNKLDNKEKEFIEEVYWEGGQDALNYGSTFKSWFDKHKDRKVWDALNEQWGLSKKMMNEPLKITYRHGDHEVSVQIDNCGGHISEAFDVFLDVLKGAGFAQESIDNYLKGHESNT